MNLNNNKLEYNTDFSKWLNFFKDCNLPLTICRNYTILFTNNRMKFNMLTEINKELLHEIGVVAVGDVLSILKYIKKLENINDSKNDLKKELLQNNDLSKRLPEMNSIQPEKDNICSNIMTRLKFKNETGIEIDNDCNNSNNNYYNNLGKILIKTDNIGNRKVIKSNNKEELSKNQTKLFNINKPILKRTITSPTSCITNSLRNNQDIQQGQVALKLLGSFIKKPNNESVKINDHVNINNNDSVFSRIKF